MNRTLSGLLLLVLSADALLLFLLPVMVYAYTSSLSWSGLAYAMAWLPRILVTPLVGASIDQWGVRRVSVVADLVKLAGCLYVAQSLVTMPSALTVTLCAGLLNGLVAIGNAQSLIAYEKMIALVSCDVDRDVNMLCRIDQLAMILGPLLGFIVYGTSATTLLVVAACLYAVNAGCYYFSHSVPGNAISREATVSISAVSNLRLIWLTPLLVSSVIVALGNNAFDGLVEASAVSLIDRAMQLPIQYFAFVDICAGVCGVAATLLYPRLSSSMSPLRLFTWAAVFTSVASASMILSQTFLPGFLTLYALNIAGKVFMGNFCRSLRIRLVPVGRLARVSSLIVLMNQSVLPLVGMALYLFGEPPGRLSAMMLAALSVTVLGAWLIRSQMHASLTSEAKIVPPS